MRDVQPGRRAVERGGVAAGPAADDDDVVVLGRGDHLQRCRRPCVGSRFGLYRACPAGSDRSGCYCCWAWSCWTTWRVAADLDERVRARTAAAGEDAADRRDVVVVAAVADRDVALARPAAALVGSRASQPQPGMAASNQAWVCTLHLVAVHVGAGGVATTRRSSPTRSGRGCRCCGTGRRRGGRSPGTRPWPWPAPRSRRRRCRWRPACTGARCARSGAGPARCPTTSSPVIAAMRSAAADTSPSHSVCIERLRYSTYWSRKEASASSATRGRHGDERPRASSRPTPRRSARATRAARGCRTCRPGCPSSRGRRGRAPPGGW